MLARLRYQPRAWRSAAAKSARAVATSRANWLCRLGEPDQPQRVHTVQVGQDGFGVRLGGTLSLGAGRGRGRGPDRL
jgi:hypothetical protein